MADVFISYFKAERDLTQALADDITAAGFSMWWDTNLLPDDRFRSVIDAQIEACTRAVIIWTPQSIKRDWVISEADHAHRLGKLTNTYASGLDLAQIPKPFAQVNAVALKDRDKIIATLVRAKKVPSKKTALLSIAASRQIYPVAEAAQIVETAQRLDAETQHEGWEADRADYAIHLITAAEEVLQAIEAFEDGLQSAELTDFSHRVWLRRLQRVIEDGRKTLKKEINWLQAHTTHGVVSGARNDLHFTAGQFLEACRRM